MYNFVLEKQNVLPSVVLPRMAKRLSIVLWKKRIIGDLHNELLPDGVKQAVCRTRRVSVKGSISDSSGYLREQVVGENPADGSDQRRKIHLVIKNLHFLCFSI